MELAGVILDASYGASPGKIARKIRESRKVKEKEIAEYRDRRNYATLLYRLKTQGFISEKVDDTKKGKFLTLTTKGSIKLGQLKNTKADSLPATSYAKEISNNFVIITFDVPEESRRKRAWLRSALKNIGLSMLQKSVWIGKVKIPGEFIDDLAKLKLIDYVEILEITKTGSLKRLG